jgi:hypothetical protein
MSEYRAHDAIGAGSRKGIATVGDQVVSAASIASFLGDRPHHDFTAPSAMSGETLGMLPSIVDLAPHSIVIVVGSTELAGRRSVEHLVRNIELLLVSLRRELPDVCTLIQSILPRERELASQIRDANRHLWQFAPTAGAHFLDVWPRLALDDGELNPAFSDDRVNLNAAGNEALLLELGPALERLENAPPMSRPIKIITGANPALGANSLR